MLCVVCCVLCVVCGVWCVWCVVCGVCGVVCGVWCVVCGVWCVVCGVWCVVCVVCGVACVVCRVSCVTIERKNTTDQVDKDIFTITRFQLSFVYDVKITILLFLIISFFIAEDMYTCDCSRNRETVIHDEE